jgi:predicted RNase H-like nuclease
VGDDSGALKEQMDAYVLGIDGCRTGWLVCHYEVSTRQMNFRIFPNFEEILSSHESAKFIAVDIPIGLWDDGQHRCCDIEARRLLAPHRSSSVFPAPCRSLLGAGSYPNACAMSLCRFGKSVTMQSYAIYPKIAEVDRLMSPELQQRVFEVHPELCFWSFNRWPMLHRKKSREGYEERRLLLNACGFQLPEFSNWRDIALDELVGASRDDVLDAAVAARTAYRAYCGKSERLPCQPVVDEKGLRMEMIY